MNSRTKFGMCWIGWLDPMSKDNSLPPLLTPEAVVNPDGEVPKLQSFYEAGAIFDRLVPTLGDAEQDSTPLLTAIRKAGGIRCDGITTGELRRLGIKESGTTGLVNELGGLAPDRMREAMVEAGYLAEDSTVDDLFQAVEGELRAIQRKTRAAKFAKALPAPRPLRKARMASSM